MKRPMSQANPVQQACQGRHWLTHPVLHRITKIIGQMKICFAPSMSAQHPNGRSATPLNSTVDTRVSDTSFPIQTKLDIILKKNAIMAITARRPRFTHNTRKPISERQARLRRSSDWSRLTNTPLTNPPSPPPPSLLCRPPPPPWLNPPRGPTRPTRPSGILAQILETSQANRFKLPGARPDSSAQAHCKPL
eukprot:431039-Pelagomonas_calceolata.AAC.1